MAKTVLPGFFTLMRRVDSEQLAYERCIGRFIMVFAEAEISLLYVAITYSTMLPYRLGLAVLAPLRIDTGITTLKRVIESRKLRSKRARELLHVLEQLAVINKARNDLLHYGVGSDRVISTKYLTHHRRLARRRPFSRKIVLQLTADIEDIVMYLNCHFRPTLDNVERAFRRLYPLGVLPPWRYKYREPKNSRRKRRDRSPARASQPKPLQASP